MDVISTANTRSCYSLHDGWMLHPNGFQHVRYCRDAHWFLLAELLCTFNDSCDDVLQIPLHYWKDLCSSRFPFLGDHYATGDAYGAFIVLPSPLSWRIRGLIVGSSNVDDRDDRNRVLQCGRQTTGILAWIETWSKGEMAPLGSENVLEGPLQGVEARLVINEPRM